MQFLRWLLFRRIRKGGELLGIVRKHYHHQRDVLPAKNLAELEAAMAEYEKVLRSPQTTKAQLRAASDKFEETAHRWLKPYPHAAYRDNFESLLGTVVIIFAFKTFFATPMEIPTGSAQPTYYGITHEDLRDKPGVAFPTGLQRVWERVAKGVSYYEVVAEADGPLEGISEPVKQIGFGKIGLGKKIAIRVGGREYPISFAPEDPPYKLSLIDQNTGRPYKSFFKKGEYIVRCRVVSGDRLFVERLTYNFRKPRRGEYFVFQSTGIPGTTQGTHYIKRLIAMGGEKVRIGDDRHVYIDGKRLEKTDPGFEKIYSFDTNKPAADSQYSGHVNGTVYGAAYRQWFLSVPHGGIAKGDLESSADQSTAFMQSNVGRNFPDEKTVYEVRPNTYLGFGDNTMSSADGRAWGVVPREKVIGKSLFVMWPFTSRWGF